MIVRVFSYCVFACVLVSGTMVTTVQARIVHDWSYDVLVERADLIVIGSVVSSKRVQFDFDRVPLFRQLLRIPNIGTKLRHVLIAETTTIRVRALLKGKVKGRTVKVFHFSFTGSPPVEIEGLPNFFKSGIPKKKETKEGEGKKGRKISEAYLFFLKRRQDGLWVPVTGQYDGGFSVKQLRSRVFGP